MKPEPVRFSPRLVLLPGCEVEAHPASAIMATPRVKILKSGFMQLFLNCIVESPRIALLKTPG
jgi:hypothetical protein